MVTKKIWSRLALGTALATGLVFAASIPASGSHDYGHACQQRLEADRARIDPDAHRYGEHSRQVDHDVAKMDETRQWCRDHKADWDHSRFDVGIYFRP